MSFSFLQLKVQKSLMCLTLVLSLGSGVAQAMEDSNRRISIDALLILMTASQIANLAQYYFPTQSSAFSSDLEILQTLNPEHLEEVIGQIAIEASQVPLAHSHLGGIQFHNNQILFQLESLNTDQFLHMFFLQAEINHWVMPENADVQIQMIIAHMMRSSSGISFATVENACREIYFRLMMISGAEGLAEHTEYCMDPNDDSYKFFSDTKKTKKSKKWKSIKCQEKQAKKYKNVTNSAFTFSTDSTPYEAIMSCYEGCQELDCVGFALTHTMGSLAHALGEEEFNKIFSEHLVIAPLNVFFGNEHNSLPILNEGILVEETIESYAELLPGDVVYFENLPDYEELDPTGYWAGEYCIYLGTDIKGVQMFVGLGLYARPPEGVIEELSTQYIAVYNIDQDKKYEDGLATAKLQPKQSRQKALKKVKKPVHIDFVPNQKKQKLKGWHHIVGGAYPGLSKQIYRLYFFRNK